MTRPSKMLAVLLSLALSAICSPDVSATPVEVTAGEDILGLGDLTTCELMNAVDSYATLVTTSPPMRESFAHQTQYNRHIPRYNRELEIAQNNTFPWKYGNSILSGLKEVYRKANAFGGEFQRKLDINQKEIQALSTRELNQKHLDRLKKDIQNLQDEITGAKHVLQATDAAAVRQYFEGVITSKTQELERKQQQVNSYSKEGLVLSELINFLGYVGDDADEVGSLTNKLQLQLTTLMENIGTDSEAYDRYAVMTDEDIRILSNEQGLIEGELGGIIGEESRLESAKSALNDQIDSLNARNAEISQQVAELLYAMQNKSDQFHSLEETLCRFDGPISALITPSSSPEEVQRACEYLMRQRNVDIDTSSEEGQIKRLRQEARQNRRLITGLLRKVDSITEELKSLFSSVAPQKTRLDQVRVELASFQSHANDLENLQTGASTALSVLVRLEEQLQALQDSFDPISANIQFLIGQANAGLSEDNKQQKRLEVEQSIANLQQTLVSLNLPDVSNC